MATPVLLTLVAAAALVASAIGGPWLLRRAAPALVRCPRAAVVLLVGSIALWVGALLSLGLLLAWAGSGPALLPGDAAAVCRRCMEAANPFPQVGSGGAAPAVVLVGLPLAVTLTLVAGMAEQLRRRRRRSGEIARELIGAERASLLHGRLVTVVEATERLALTFPARHGGVVVSTGALAALEDDELAAVLAHEHAHLHQRHHLISGLVASVTVFLRWVPLVRAAADSLPHYLEIAADDRARHQVGTPALVSALLKLGDRTGPDARPMLHDHALHAAGPERVRRLVGPVTGLAGAVPAVAVTVHLVVLGLLSVAVYVPYAAAALGGC